MQPTIYLFDLDKTIGLKDTVDYMVSGDFRQRILAEWAQLEIRMAKLGTKVEELITDIEEDGGNADDAIEEPDIVQLLDQLNSMQAYSKVLMKRLTEECGYSLNDLQDYILKDVDFNG